MRWLLLLLVGCTDALVGCTDAHLYGVDTRPNLPNRISLQGELCTDDPSAVAFPVKEGRIDPIFMLGMNY